MKRIVSILLVLLLSCTDLFPIFAENRSEKDFYNDEYTFKDCKLFYKFEPLPFGTSCKGTFKIKNTSNKPISNYIIKFNLKNLIDDYNGAELDEYDEENDLYTFLSMDDEIKPNFTKTITFYYETDADGKVYKAQNIRFMTLADMNSTDTDNDGLNDFWEEELKTDPTNPDTDMDGLTDGFEFNKAGTDPLNPNSEDPKVNDADLDPDFDSLKNIEEQNAETDPLDKDSDGDTLSDYDEINKYATSPILSDTDMDGLTDDYEIKIGLNPNNPITDGVTPDGKRTFDQTSGEIAKSSAVINSDNWLKPSVSGNVNGNIDENIKIDIASYDAFSDNKAAVSDILLIKSNYETPLKLNFTYDTPYVGDINNLSIVQYSTEDGLELLDTVISEENKSISAEINGGGMYFVLDVDKFLKGIGINVMHEVEKMSNVTTRTAPNLNETIRYDNYRNIIERTTGSSIASTITTPAPIFFRAGGVVGKGVGKADIVFVIDSTGSMSGAIGNVTYNINDFADKLTFDYGIDADFALIDYKDITIDGKDSTVLHKNGSDVWYTDPDELKTALSKLSVGGGGDTPETPIDALQLAQTLNFRADAAKFVILLTDAPYKMDNVSEIKDMSEIASNLQKNNMYVAVIAYDKDEYKELLALKDSLYGDINADFSETLLQIVYMLDQNVNDGTWVILDDFQSVKLNKSDSLFTDTDKDGLSDKKELGESMQMNLMPFILKILKSHFIPETLYNGKKEITVWKYKSNPVLIDTDYDGIPDGHIDYDGSLVKPDKRPRKKMFKNITLSRESEQCFTGYKNTSNFGDCKLCGGNEFEGTLKNDKFKLNDRFTIDYSHFFNAKLSNKEYDQTIALWSIMLATLAYHNSSIDNLTEKMTGMNQIEFYKMTGLKDIKTVELSKTYKDDDISEITMGHRNVTCNGKNKEIFVIAVRGTDATIEEWSSNFDVGADSSNYYDCNNSDWENKNHHKSFDVAAYRLYGAVDGYINSYGQNTDRVVLLTGHSRGAAISNIIGAKLEDTGKYKTYTYTFATPNTTTLSNIDKYKTIFNTVNEDDLVACMPLTKWRFTKYGKTLSVSVGKKYSYNYTLPKKGTRMWEDYIYTLKGYNFNGNKNNTVQSLNKICENRNEIYKYAGDKASNDEKCIYYKKYKFNENEAKKLLEKQKDKFGKRMSRYAESCYEFKYCNNPHKMPKRYYMATEQKPAFLMMNLADVASTKQHNNIGTGLDRIVDYKIEIDKYPDFKYLSGKFNFRLAPRYHWARNFFVWSGADSTSFGEFIHMGGMVHAHMPLTYYVITKEGVH